MTSPAPPAGALDPSATAGAGATPHTTLGDRNNTISGVIILDLVVTLKLKGQVQKLKLF